MRDVSMEELRQQLNEMLEEEEFAYDKILKVSQELDLKILQYMRGMQRRIERKNDILSVMENRSASAE